MTIVFHLSHRALLHSQLAVVRMVVDSGRGNNRMNRGLLDIHDYTTRPFDPARDGLLAFIWAQFLCVRTFVSSELVVAPLLFFECRACPVDYSTTDPGNFKLTYLSENVLRAPSGIVDSRINLGRCPGAPRVLS